MSDDLPDKPPVTPREQLAQKVASQATADDAEEFLWSGSYSTKAMAGHWVLLGLVSLALFVAILMISALRSSSITWIVFASLLVLAWGGTWLIAMYRKLSFHYELTTQRFKHRAGILTRVNDRIELIDIDDVTFKQGPIQALLNVGDINIKSSDSSHPELILHGIEGCRDIADRIDNARRTERRKRGLHIESI